MPTVQFTWHIGMDIIIIMPPLQYNILYKTPKIWGGDMGNDIHRENWLESYASIPDWPLTRSDYQMKARVLVWSVIVVWSVVGQTTTSFYLTTNNLPHSLLEDAAWCYICWPDPALPCPALMAWCYIWGAGAESPVKGQWWCVMMGLHHFTLWCLSLFQLAKLNYPSL